MRTQALSATSRATIQRTRVMLRQSAHQVTVTGHVAVGRIDWRRGRDEEPVWRLPPLTAPATPHQDEEANA